MDKKTQTNFCSIAGLNTNIKSSLNTHQNYFYFNCQRWVITSVAVNGVFYESTPPKEAFSHEIFGCSMGGLC